MRYALKKDISHKAIVEGLRAVGAKVAVLFDVDLAVNFRGQAWLMEVKSPEVVSKRTGGLKKGALRKKQLTLQEIFGPAYVIVTDLSSALTAIGYYE